VNGYIAGMIIITGGIIFMAAGVRVMTYEEKKEDPCQQHRLQRSRPPRHR
jgi:hypothetical protein